MINQGNAIREFYYENRRTIELITELDKKVEDYQITLDELKNKMIEQSLNHNKTFQPKLIKLRYGIDSLFQEILILSDIKMELINKLESSTNFLKDNLENHLNKYELKDDNKEEEKESKICVCNKKQNGKTIICENIKCKISLFHLKCFELTKPPTESWFCSEKCYLKVNNSQL